VIAERASGLRQLNVLDSSNEYASRPPDTGDTGR
jgi:hypothetical protein